MSKVKNKMKFIDIGANLTDGKFAGSYYGTKKHEADLQHVLHRATEHGVDKIMITSGCLQDIWEALKIIEEHKEEGEREGEGEGERMQLVTTVGVHPTRCDEFVFGDITPFDDEMKNKFDEYTKAGLDGKGDTYMEALKELIEQHRESIVAIGEFGLDYDRLEFCGKERQKEWFGKQFVLAEETGLPCFFHCRNSTQDFLSILRENESRFTKGVVHSFDGSIEDLQSMLEFDNLFIGINGCSLKTQENLDVVAQIPVDRLMIETDAPWCGIKNTHAGKQFVKTEFPAVKEKKWTADKGIKGRSEPAHIVQVLEVVAHVMGVDEQELAEQVYTNTKNVFF
eukprot:TRINITY_DN2486_c1_g1_i2.p1 TRINITY_DN2486_c1_g1~~TRINITY_DN2486_c1_g1_i2.p1  ORF type:complete len:363 (+),score=96.29 TRINITY_DN2486_c1_g1_i2:74-1090(+)